MSYNSKYKGAEVESLLDKVNDMGEIPTKVSQLENDVPYVTEDVASDGVYAVDASGKLIDYNTADSSCLGVALVAGEHKFMIAKSDATDGSNSTLYWTKSYSDLSLTNYNKADGTNSSGFLPKPDGTFGGSTHLSGDFTTWKAGALSDFNGKANTAIIAAASSDAIDMCTVLNTFNASDSHNDWYVPACGQLALMYLNMTEINAALAKIGGTALAAEHYWSSSERSSGYAWYVNFYYGDVSYNDKDYGNLVRFVRDISTPKPLKERVSKLESTKQDMIEDLDDIRDGASKGATALQPQTGGSGTKFLADDNTYKEIDIPEGDFATKEELDEKQDKVDIVDHGTGDTTFALTPNILHRWGTVTSLTITLAAPVDTTVANYYMFEFTSGSTATTLSLPSTVTWANDVSIEADKKYQVSILNNCGVIGGF